MEKVYILTQYSLPENKHNMNAYQRIYYGARYGEIHLLIRRRQLVSQELAGRVILHRAPVENRVLFFLYAVLLAFFLRLRGCRIIITEPSGFAGVGFLAKYLAGYFWVMDIWDTPRRRGDLPPRLSDRIVFILINRADLFIYSVMPEAAPYLKKDSKRDIYLKNAIDLRRVEDSPPFRSAEDKLLQLAFIRSKFARESGLETLSKAAEYLKIWGCPVIIHIVGEIPEELLKAINSSAASDLFYIHGFIPFTPLTKNEFLKNIHVGLVPFEDTNNLRYTYPIKVLEYMGHGQPVIASKLPGLSALVIHEENGLLFEPGNAEELARAIQRLQQDHQLWEKLAWNALKSIKRFDADKKNQIIFSEIFRRHNAPKPRYS